MKTKHLPLFMTAVILMSTASCTKEKEDNLPDHLTQRIQGKWEISSITITENLSGVDRTTTYEGTPADYMDFRTDGKLHTSFSGKTEISEYTVHALENKITIDGDNNTIQEITDNTLVLYDKDNIATLGTTITTYYLKK